MCASAPNNRGLSAVIMTDCLCALLPKIQPQRSEGLRAEEGGGGGGGRPETWGFGTHSGKRPGHRTGQTQGNRLLLSFNAGGAAAGPNTQRRRARRGSFEAAERVAVGCRFGRPLPRAEIYAPAARQRTNLPFPPLGSALRASTSA